MFFLHGATPRYPCLRYIIAYNFLELSFLCVYIARPKDRQVESYYNSGGKVLVSSCLYLSISLMFLCLISIVLLDDHSLLSSCLYLYVIIFEYFIVVFIISY